MQTNPLFHCADPHQHVSGASQTSTGHMICCAGRRPYCSPDGRPNLDPCAFKRRSRAAQEANRRHDLSLVEYLVKEVFFYVGLDHLRMSARLRRHPTIQARAHLLHGYRRAIATWTSESVPR